MIVLRGRGPGRRPAMRIKPSRWRTRRLLARLTAAEIAVNRGGGGWPLERGGGNVKQGDLRRRRSWLIFVLGDAKGRQLLEE
jgi:hypothetical protein